jgi:hypothetical protein
LWYLHKFLKYIKYIFLEFITTLLSFYSHPITGKVSVGIIFPFSYMCTQCLHYIHPVTHFPNTSPKWCQHPQARPILPSCSLIFLILLIYTPNLAYINHRSFLFFRLTRGIVKTSIFCYIKAIFLITNFTNHVCNPPLSCSEL